MNSNKDSIYLVKSPVFRPEEPRHFMVLEEVETHMLAIAQGRQIANTGMVQPDVLKLKEVGNKIYDPVYYFARSDVNMSNLKESGKTRTTCPLKGIATYFHVTAGDMVLENAAWSYEEVFEFDERLNALKSRIAFDSRVKTLEFN